MLPAIKFVDNGVPIRAQMLFMHNKKPLIFSQGNFSWSTVDSRTIISCQMKLFISEMLIPIISASGTLQCGNGGPRSSPVIRLSPWIMAFIPLQQVHVEDVHDDKVVGCQHGRQVKVRNRARRYRQHNYLSNIHWKNSAPWSTC